VLALDFGCDDIGCLIPGYALKFAGAAVLRIAFTIGIPVDTLHRVGYTVGRVGSLLIGQTPGWGDRLAQRFKFNAVAFHLPRIEAVVVIL
jgi:hypothetical protein